MKVKKKPLVTVIVPVYNVEVFLEKCLESIVNQSYQNLEIFLIDDGSTDRSKEICDAYANKDKRIKVLHQKNKGSGAARNQALKQLTGEYVSFVDSDDVLNLHFIEILLKNALENNADISGCKFEIVKSQIIKTAPSDDYEKRKYEKREYLEALLKDKINFSCCTKLFKKKVLADLSFPINQKYEDMFFLVQAVDLSKKIVETTESLYYYVMRKNSNTTSNFDVRQLDFIRTVDEICNFVSEKYQVNKNLCNRKKIQARLNILHKMLCAKESKNNIKALQEEVKKLYIDTDDKMIFSKRDKMSIRLSLGSLKIFQITFSFYVKLKPYVSAFKKR